MFTTWQVDVIELRTLCCVDGRKADGPDVLARTVYLGGQDDFVEKEAKVGMA